MRAKMPARGGELGVALALALLGMLAAGCPIISALETTRTSLSQAGWKVTNTDIESGTGHGVDGTLVVGVDFRSSLDESSSQQAEGAARVVWDSTPGQVSFLQVTVDHAAGSSPTATFRYSHARLLSLFGRRPGSLDATPLVNLAGLGRDLALGAAGALVAILAVTLLVVWLVRRRGHRRQVT